MTDKRADRTHPVERIPHAAANVGAAPGGGIVAPDGGHATTTASIAAMTALAGLLGRAQARRLAATRPANDDRAPRKETRP